MSLKENKDRGFVFIKMRWLCFFDKIGRNMSMIHKYWLLLPRM